jgi:hypothetical protein
MFVFIDNKQIPVTNFVTYLVYLIDKDSVLLLTTKFVYKEIGIEDIFIATQQIKELLEELGLLVFFSIH